MLPPLLADIQSNHSVFDMCAAPGSKTAQVLEFIRTRGDPRGFVLANDADSKRAYLLTHQMNRLNTANLGIINHFAQDYPGDFKFDRVLCDVPCSSDAAIRKLPQLWARWSLKETHNLHSLQLQILVRGLQVLKVGGKIAYSTCSLSPIENESVVAAALQRYGDKIKILKTELKGFKF